MHLAERDRAHDHGDGLVARISPDSRDDGHERGECHQLLDRVLEGADHARGDKCGDEVDGQPRPAVLHARPDRRENVFLLAQPGLREELALALAADEVDNLVYRHPADEFALLVNDWCRNQVIPLERLCGVLRLVTGLERDDVTHHDLSDIVLKFGDDQFGKRQHALQAFVPVDDEDLVGMVRQRVEAPQIPRDGLDRGVLAHADHVEIHKGADRVLGVRHRRAQLLAFLDGQGLEDIVKDLFGQVRREVGDLVGL